MEPLGVAPCFLNGSPVIARVLLRHGDRLLWGNNHFFRVNCPRPSPTSEEQVQPDFNFAREELVLKEMSNDPIQVSCFKKFRVADILCIGLLPLDGNCSFGEAARRRQTTSPTASTTGI